MQKEDMQEAVKTGHKAASVLADVLRDLAKEHYCPDAVGFEGPETFPDCGACVYCLAKQMAEDEEI